MVAQQRGDRLAAPFKGDVAHLVRVNPGLFGQQRRLHPVLTADGGTRADHHAVGIALHGAHQLLEVLIGGIVAHRDHAVIGAHRRQPAHIVHPVTAKFPL